MDYKLIRNEAKEAMKGFKGHFFGLLVTFLGIQIAINLAIGYILPDSIILPTIVGLLIQALVVPALIGIVQCAIKTKVKGTYSFVMPSFKNFLAVLGVLAINTIASQAILGMMLIPGIIGGAIAITFLPSGAILIIMILAFITIGLVTTFIYMQALLGVCEIVDGKSFVDAMSHSWSALFSNFKFFIRASLIMLPVVIGVWVLIIGLFIMVFAVALVNFEVTSVVILMMVILAGLITLIVLGIILTLKLFSIIYIGYQKIKEKENIKYEEMNINLNLEKDMDV